MALILLLTFFFFLLCGVPIAVSLGLSAMAGILYGGFPLQVMSSLVYSSIAKFALLAIPYFVLTGVLMEYAGISKRLIHFARVCLGHRKGGMVYVLVVVACFFAAISGSGPATVAALGGILIPAMEENGYDKGMASALMASSGGIGIIIPPSIAMVVYAQVAEVSVGAMFTGGIVPGILIGIAFIIAALITINRDKSLRTLPKASGKEVWKAFLDAIPGLLTPVIILGGIYGGIFTPTEAAGFAVVYSLIVGVFIYKEIKIRSLWKLFVDSAVTTSVVMYIIACAGIFAWILTTSSVAANLSAALLNLTTNKYLLLLIMNIIFIVAGCFIETSSSFYILCPILLPVIHSIGYDPVAFGVFMISNMAVGMVTPPVGVNLYVASNISNLPIGEISKKAIPFIIAGFIAVLLITYIPNITMFLPHLLGFEF